MFESDEITIIINRKKTIIKNIYQNSGKFLYLKRDKKWFAIQECFIVLNISKFFSFMNQKLLFIPTVLSMRHYTKCAKNNNYRLVKLKIYRTLSLTSFRVGIRNISIVIDKYFIRHFIYYRDLINKKTNIWFKKNELF